jgi:enoyl-CoA hydratase/carnithine racemase
MSAESPTATADQPVLLRLDTGGVTTLTLNRPAQFNALSEALLAALQEQLDRIAEQGSVRVVVLAAAGRAFCAGHDLKQMRANPDQDYYQELFNRCGRVMQSIAGLPQPVIAKVQGTATAAGCQLVAACDLAVAADHARFAVSGVNLGLFCSTPAVALSRNIGRKAAMEMLLTGEFVSASRAAEMGLLNRVVAADELSSVVSALTASILGKPAVAVRAGKQMFYRQLEMGLEDAYLFASDVMACNMMAEDTVEGIDAFIEKRPPRY